MLKKEKGTEKRKKVYKDFIEDKLHFIRSKKAQYMETVNSGKVDQKNQALEKLDKIKERREMKEKLKHDVLS